MTSRPAPNGGRATPGKFWIAVTGGEAELAEAVYQACLHHGLHLGRGLPRTLIAAPALDAGALLGARLRDILTRALPDAPDHQP